MFLFCCSCAVDMWSLGCILFELHSGRKLFGATSSAELAQQHVISFGTTAFRCFSDTGKFYRKIFSALPMGTPQETGLMLDVRDQHLSDFIRKCLCIDPSKRLTPHIALAHPFLAQFGHRISMRQPLQQHHQQQQPSTGPPVFQETPERLMQDLRNLAHVHNHNKRRRERRQRSRRRLVRLCFVRSLSADLDPEVLITRCIIHRINASNLRCIA